MRKIVCIFLSLMLLAIPVSADSDVKITMQPQNYQYPEYSVAMYTVEASGSNLHCTWYIEYEGKTYNLSDNTNGVEPWEGYAGENYGGFVDGNKFSWFFGGIEAGLNGAEIWCVIEDGHNDVTSQRAIITVQGDAMPPEIKGMPAEVVANRGDEVEFRCVAASNSDAQLEFQWYETATGKLQDIMALDGETSDYVLYNSGQVGVKYYVCCVTTADGGRAYSSVLPVTILDAAQQPAVDMEILTKTLPDATAGQPYEVKLQCNDPSGVFSGYYNPGGANDLDASGLKLSGSTISGTPAKAGTYIFTVCASGDYGEDYLEYTLTVKESEQTPDTTETAAEVTEPASTAPDQVDTTVPASEEPSAPAQTGEDISAQKPAKSGMPWWGFLLIALGSAGAGCGVAFLLLKKKK